jgi:hypothetical protein
MEYIPETQESPHTFLRFHPSAILLLAQILQLFLFILLGDQPGGQILINSFGMLVLILVVWVISHSPSINWIAWVLAVPAFLLLIYSLVTRNTAFEGWAYLLEGILYFYAAGGLIAYMMKDDQVTTDELFAAGATFTLLAWGYGFMYLACQAWLPGSFFSMVVNPARSLTFIELLSLSFTNLTATGLSDILAVSVPARVLIMLEQFSGIGYVAMVVSRLIGLSLMRKKRKKATMDDGMTSL